MVSHICLLVELGPICNSTAASLCLKSCVDHSLLKSYNGGLWKNIYRSGPCRFKSKWSCLFKITSSLWDRQVPPQHWPATLWPRTAQKCLSGQWTSPNFIALVKCWINIYCCSHFVCLYVPSGGGQLIYKVVYSVLPSFLKFVLLSKRAVVSFYCVLAIVWVSVLECLFLGMWWLVDLWFVIVAFPDHAYMFSWN